MVSGYREPAHLSFRSQPVTASPLTDPRTRLFAMTRTTSLAALCLGVALAVTACSPKSPPPPGTPSLPVTEAASPTAGNRIDPEKPTAEPNRTLAPTEDPTGEVFRFDEAARFSDGVQIEVQKVTAQLAGEGDQGAEGTDGQIVVAEVLISNDSPATFDANRIIVQGFYGESVGAPLVVDADGAFGTGFEGVVEAGEDVRATFAFAIPHAQLKNVAIYVFIYTLDDPEHPAVRFSGRVAKP